jgi:hypothetical protein
LLLVGGSDKDRFINEMGFQLVETDIEQYFSSKLKPKGANDINNLKAILLIIPMCRLVDQAQHIDWLKDKGILNSEEASRLMQVYFMRLYWERDMKKARRIIHLPVHEEARRLLLRMRQNLDLNVSRIINFGIGIDEENDISNYHMMRHN